MHYTQSQINAARIDCTLHGYVQQISREDSVRFLDWYLSTYPRPDLDERKTFWGEQLGWVEIPSIPYICGAKPGQKG